MNDKQKKQQSEGMLEVLKKHVITPYDDIKEAHAFARGRAADREAASGEAANKKGMTWGETIARGALVVGGVAATAYGMPGGPTLIGTGVLS
jgi:hypothetical protein